MTDFAEEVNAIPAANVSNLTEDKLESAIPQQTKDKAHCFCPLLAKLHGEEAAVILQGLGYKVSKSKKVKEGRKWHYDTLKALVKRWPYLSDSGIHGILERQVELGHVFKGRYNKWSGDRTVWYSVRDELVKRAIEDDGKLWFDVPAAVHCRSIIAGTLYQNLRYHLLLLRADHPGSAPFVKINKAALARVLPWSLSSVRRGYAELVSRGLIAENPVRPGEYTICNSLDLVVPQGMRKIGSSTDEIGSSMEMGIGSSTEMTGSSTDDIGSSTEMTGSSRDDIGSSTDEIGSSTDNYTHCKPFQRHIHKHHSLTAPPSVVGACANAADAAKASGNQHTCIQQNSPTVPVQEHAEPGTSPFTDTRLSLQQVRHRIMALEAQVCSAEQEVIDEQLIGVTNCFVTEELPIAAIRIGWSSTSADEILAAVLPVLHQNFHEHGTNQGWSREACELITLRSAEIVAGGFLLCNQANDQVHGHFKHCWDAVWDVYQALPTIGNHPEATVEDKADSLMVEIRSSNKNGWPTYSRGDIEFKMAASSTVHKAAVQFFGDHAEVSTHDVWKAMSDCVEVYELNDKPEGFDPLWKARKGVNPAFLFKFWEDIRNEIDAAEILVS